MITHRNNKASLLAPYYGGKCLLLGLLMLGLINCGGGANGDTDDTALPPGTVVTVNPVSQTFNVTEFRDDNGNCLYGVLFQDVPVLVSVVNTQGGAISDVDVTFSLNFAGNTFTPGGPQVLKLYEDRNGNGVADDPQELVSDVDNPLFKSRTAEFSGQKLMIVRMDLACAFRGQLFVIAGAFLGSMDLEITADQATPPPAAGNP